MPFSQFAQAFTPPPPPRTYNLMPLQHPTASEGETASRKTPADKNEHSQHKWVLQHVISAAVDPLLWSLLFVPRSMLGPGGLTEQLENSHRRPSTVRDPKSPQLIIPRRNKANEIKKRHFVILIFLALVFISFHPLPPPPHGMLYVSTTSMTCSGLSQLGKHINKANIKQV